MEFDVNNYDRLMVCGDEEFDEAIQQLTVRDLITLVSQLQNEMTKEQQHFDDLSKLITQLEDDDANGYDRLSTKLCISQARLAQLCARNMKCFTQQSTAERRNSCRDKIVCENSTNKSIQPVQPEWRIPKSDGGIRKLNIPDGPTLEYGSQSQPGYRHGCHSDTASGTSNGQRIELRGSEKFTDEENRFPKQFRVPTVEEIIEGVKNLRMRQQESGKTTSTQNEDETSHIYEQIEPIYHSVADDGPIYANVTNEPLYDVPRLTDKKDLQQTQEVLVPVASQLILKAQCPQKNYDSDSESDYDRDSLENGENSKIAPEIPSPDYGSDEDDAAFGVYNAYDERVGAYYAEDQGLEVIVEEEEELDDNDEDEDYGSRSDRTVSQDSPHLDPKNSDEGYHHSESDDDRSSHRVSSESLQTSGVKAQLPDSAVDIADISSLDGVNGATSLSAYSNRDNDKTSWSGTATKHDGEMILFSTPRHHCVSTLNHDSGMGDSYFTNVEESKWEYVGNRYRGYDDGNKSSEKTSLLPSVKALRSQFEQPSTTTGTCPRNFQYHEPKVAIRQIRRSKSVVSEADQTIPEMLDNLNTSGARNSNTLPAKFKNSWSNGTSSLRTAKPIFSSNQPPDDVIPSIIAQFGNSVEMPERVQGQSALGQWDPTLLLQELYKIQSPQPDHNAETSSSFINIDGYLDKLPSGRRKATFWNAWKRRYFRLKDGYLYYYQNHTSEKPSLMLNLMGGHIDSMDTSILGVDDGSNLDITIDDGKGHYVVVRCSTKNEMEQWRTALSTHVAENFNLTYSQPVPAYPQFYEDVLIIDLGSCSVRAGILCNQPTLPQLFFPTVSSTDRDTGDRIYGTEALSPQHKASGSVSFPLRPSTKLTKFSVDLDTVIGLLSKVFRDLNVDPADYQIQLSLPRTFTVRTQTEVLRILFDDFNVRSVNLTSQTVLSLLSYNTSSGIVVDVGERMDIIPIIDGYIVEPGVSRIPYGGMRVMEHLQHFLVQQHLSGVDPFLVRYVFENLCYCAENYNEELQKFYSDPESFEASCEIKQFFPESASWPEITLDNGRFQASEGLFNPDAWGLDHPGVHKLVHRAIQECSLDIRKEMTRSIYLSGGLTLLPGFPARLESEVNKLTPPSLTPKVHASPYRYHAAYLGACILASSPGFQEAKITSDDWNQNGAQSLRKWHL